MQRLRFFDAGETEMQQASKKKTGILFRILLGLKREEIRILKA